EVGGNAQPGEDLVGFTRFFQMRMARRIKVAAETFDPVMRRPEESRLLCVFVAVACFPVGRRVLLGGYMRSAANCLVKNRRIITAMKINVCFGKKMVGNDLPAVPHHNTQQTV